MLQSQQTNEAPKVRTLSASTLNSLLSYLGTLGPEGAHIPEMPLLRERHSFLQLHVEPTVFNKFQAFFKLKHNPLSLATLIRLLCNSLELEITGLSCRGWYWSSNE